VDPQEDTEFLDALSFSRRAVVYGEWVIFLFTTGILSHKKLNGYIMNFA
jgi:hypothetical protein